MGLHAIWHQDELWLWSDEGAAVGPAELRARVGEMCADSLLASIAVESRLDLWLPCDAAGVVMPSASDAPRTDTFLAPTAVSALRLVPADAIDLFTGLTDSSPQGAGDSIAYFARLGRMVVDRLGRGQFYPDLDDEGPGRWRGVWRLLLDSAADVDFLQQYAAVMPPAARSAVAAGAGESDAIRIVESFLHSAADALIRRDVSADDFFLSIHDRAADFDSAAEIRWLSALLGAKRELRGDPDDLQPFVDQARAWTGRLNQAQSLSPARLVLTLIEPEMDEKPAEGAGEIFPVDPAVAVSPVAEPGWTVTVQLCPVQEDAEALDPAALWADGPEPPAILRRAILHRRSQFVSELTRAAEVFPPAHRAMQSLIPCDIVLSTAEAHALIRQWAPQLEERGITVRLPEWTTRREAAPSIELYIRPRDEDDPLDADGSVATGGGDWTSRPGRLGLDSLLDFDWQIAVGDLKLSAEEFRRLLERDSPLVRHQGRWLQIDPAASRKALEFLGSKKGGKMTFAEAMRTALYATPSETGLPILGLGGSSWIEQFLSQAPAGRLDQLEQPKSFVGEMRAYQVRGLEWMAFLQRLGIGACLADDMGLGKTIQLIALMLYEREKLDAAGRAAEPLGPTLLFAPTSVIGNWLREVQRFGPRLKAMLHHGPDRLSGDAFVDAAAQHDLVITTYNLAYRDLADLRRPAWHRLALDEAQKIKNPSAAATLAIRAISSPLRVALTGTPIENHLSELWSIMEVLNPGLLGTAGEFREKLAVPIEKLGDADRAEQLRRMIRPFVLRRLKSDPTVAADLPEKMEMKVFCNLTSEQAMHYQRIADEMLGQIDSAQGIRRRGLILAALTRLKQVCNHPAQLLKQPGPLDGRSGKCERLVEMLEEVLEEGDAALIFTQFKEMGDLLQRLLAERLRTEVLFLHGGTTTRMRDEMVRRFHEGERASRPRLFILSLRAGGLGLNLTAANHVFHFDRWWNPAVEAQATDRAHRIGQTRKVQVHKFVCIGTMEERIDRMLSEKLALAGKIIGAGDDWLTNMTTDQLRDYLTLSREAVGEF